MFDEDASRFRHGYGVAAFGFRHNLADNPLFSLDRLASAAETLLGSGHDHLFTIRNGNRKAGARFVEMGTKQKLPAEFEQLHDSDSWIRLSNLASVDQDYRDLVRTLVRDVEVLSGQAIADRITLSNLSVFMASPNVVTPYHIDHDANFLCQVSGEKDVFLYDPSDRELLPDGEIERFYTDDANAARYREDLQCRATRFRLAPGRGVHHPPLAPHWVRNGPDISVSVSVYFCTRELDRRAHVYQANHFLRKAGLNPRPPGQSGAADTFKDAGMRLIGRSDSDSIAERLHVGPRRLRAAAAPARNIAEYLRRLTTRLGIDRGG